MTRPLPRGGTLLLASIAGTAIANNYALQPELTTVAADLDVPLSVIGLVPTAALAGCTTGFALLLPLTDRLAPNRLVGVQLAALAGALALAAAASGATVLLTAYLLIGAAASVAAQASAIAGRHAPAGRRGTGVATVAAGMSAGILLSRLAGGTLTDLLGWRRMLLVFAALALLGAIAAGTLLPRRRPHPDRDYRAALTALPPLLRQFPQLRRAVAVGGLWYFAFNIVWVALVLALAQPPHSLGPSAIGLYSLAGLLGFAALPLTGRLTDRHSPATVITVCMPAAAVGTALLASGLGSPLVTGVGLALFDAGCFAAQAANQSRVIALLPARSGSLSSVYLVLYFTVGAIGTALAAPLLDTLGWRGTALTALAALLLAAALGGRTRSAGTEGSDAYFSAAPGHPDPGGHRPDCGVGGGAIRMFPGGVHRSARARSALVGQKVARTVPCDKEHGMATDTVGRFLAALDPDHREAVGAKPRQEQEQLAAAWERELEADDELDTLDELSPPAAEAEAARRVLAQGVN
ncbi:MFS transporter [Streptomyces yokosukanensis]|uniref:MFS transporter n=1 Tax=Streptomyces yokosukanensis TaxID=67386 RepID=UPI000A7EAFE9|nr:MFS transporter [Streptomyces yokosukanensis]